MTTPTPPAGSVPQRLEYLRGEIRAERISYGEIAELQSLVEHIDPSDVELLAWAQDEPTADAFRDHVESAIEHLAEVMTAETAIAERQPAYTLELALIHVKVALDAQPHREDLKIAHLRLWIAVDQANAALDLLKDIERARGW